MLSQVNAVKTEVLNVSDCLSCALGARHSGSGRKCMNAAYWEFYWDARRAFRDQFPQRTFGKMINRAVLRRFFRQGSVAKLMDWCRGR